MEIVEYLIAEGNELVGANGDFVLAQLDAEVLERYALVHLLLGVVVDLLWLEGTILHENVVGDERHDERERHTRPHADERVDDDDEEAGRDAAAEARPKARVDLHASGARRQTAHEEQNERQTAHERRDDERHRLHDARPLEVELDLERRRPHLERDGQGAIQARGEYARAAQRDYGGDDGGERTAAEAAVAFVESFVLPGRAAGVDGRCLVAEGRSTTTTIPSVVHRRWRRERVVVLTPERFALVGETRHWVVHAALVLRVCRCLPAGLFLVCPTKSRDMHKRKTTTTTRIIKSKLNFNWNCKRWQWWLMSRR